MRLKVQTYISVPMALGRHLFPFRTQKLSPAAAIILPFRWETSTVPFYRKPSVNAEGFLFMTDMKLLIVDLWRKIYYHANNPYIISVTNKDNVNIDIKHKH
jgi:hypothetical protein